MKGLLTKKVLAVAISAIVVGGGIVAATTYSSAMTLDEAKGVASNFVPESAELIESENEGGNYELSYRDEQAGKTYDLIVSKKDKAVKEFSVSLDMSEGGDSVEFTEDQIKELIKKEYSGVNEVKVNLENDGGKYCYEVTFKAPDFKGEAEINAETGVIVESTLIYGKAVTEPIDDEEEDDDADDDADDDTDDDAEGQAAVEIISEEEARNIVLAKLPGAVIDLVLLDTDDTTVQEYEIHATLGEYEYDIEINAASGVIINLEKDLINNN